MIIEATYTAQTFPMITLLPGYCYLSIVIFPVLLTVYLINSLYFPPLQFARHSCQTFHISENAANISIPIQHQSNTETSESSLCCAKSSWAWCNDDDQIHSFHIWSVWWQWCFVFTPVCLVVVLCKNYMMDFRGIWWQNVSGKIPSKRIQIREQILKNTLLLSLILWYFKGHFHCFPMQGIINGSWWEKICYISVLTSMSVWHSVQLDWI